MDPQETLCILCNKITHFDGAHQCGGEEDMLDLSVEIVENISNLLTWLKKGGHSPDWSKADHDTLLY